MPPLVQLYGGSDSDFADSMAQEIEIALREALAEAGLEPLPLPKDENPEDLKRRRVLFIAIARGVIRHLQKKQKAFVIPADPHGETNPAINVKP